MSLRAALVAVVVAAGLTSTLSSSEAFAGGKSKAKTRPAAANTIEGSYLCTFKDGDVTYKAQPCKIRSGKDSAELRFAKTGGSQRFDGVATPTEQGFTFSGKFYCPHGACDQALEGVAFSGNRSEGFVGTLPLGHGPVQVTVRPLGMKRK